jgi:hypothetical protein
MQWNLPKLKVTVGYRYHLPRTEISKNKKRLVGTHQTSQVVRVLNEGDRRVLMSVMLKNLNPPGHKESQG